MLKSQHIASLGFDVLMRTIAPNNITLGLNRTENENCNCCLFYGIMVLWSYKTENFMQHNHAYHYEDIKLWPQHHQRPFEYKMSLTWGSLYWQVFIETGPTPWEKGTNWSFSYAPIVITILVHKLVSHGYCCQIDIFIADIQKEVVFQFLSCFLEFSEFRILNGYVHLYKYQ